MTQNEDNYFMRYNYIMIKRALLIGINYKNDPGSVLRGCINDIRHIRDILVYNCGYEPQNIRVLTEEDDIKPSRLNIESGIHWLVSGAQAGDTLFFHYSGHGSYVTDESRDESDGKDEVIVPLDYLEQGMITDDWLFANMIAKVPRGATLWGFSDCCHSGTLFDLKYNYKSMCSFKKRRMVDGMAYNAVDWTDKFVVGIERTREIIGRVCLFSGCQDQETSADAHITNKYQGAFTYCLIEALKTKMERTSNGKVILKPGTIKLRHLLKEINCRLDLNKFTDQNTQLSLSTYADFENTFDP